jgi:thiol-disulfide isomerase/thioredoxin
MARTLSTMLPLGTQAPGFALPDTNDHTVCLEDLADTSGLVVMFISNHCPFVIHLKSELTRFAKAYAGQINVVAIGSNDVGKYPQDGPQAMSTDRDEFGYPFPYLFDESQETAKRYRAACTPDFYLFDGSLRLVYRGQFDGSRPGNDVPVTGIDLRQACDALLSNAPLPEEQTPSMGCNIKWIPGNEPPYFER